MKVCVGECAFGSSSCWAKNKLGCNERKGKVKHASPDNQVAGGNSTPFAQMDDKALLLLAKPLLQLLCDAGDGAAEGRGTWISFGVTKNGSSYVLTAHEMLGKLSIFGETVLEVLQNVPNLL